MDYTLVSQPYEVSLTAGAALTGGQALVVSGVNQVSPAGANSAATIGVAAHDAASGARVTVFVSGQLHETTASGTVAAGADLISATGGAVASRGSGANRVGIALTAATDGQLVRWLTAGPGAAKSTGATAGSPGSFTPSGSYTPFALADLAGVTASPGSAWTTGQRVVLGNGSNAYWNGTAWVAGTAP